MHTNSQTWIYTMQQLNAASTGEDLRKELLTSLQSCEASHRVNMSKSEEVVYYNVKFYKDSNKTVLLFDEDWPEGTNVDAQHLMSMYNYYGKDISKTFSHWEPSTPHLNANTEVYAVWNNE